MGEVKRNWLFYGTCTGLIVAGLVVIWTYPHGWPQRELLVSVAQALIIAGILALTVDRFIKERLLRELTRDVSQYLIGYELPKEIQDRIHDIMGTALVRHNYQQRYRLAADAGQVRAEVELTWEIVNYSSTPRMYAPALYFDRNERPDIQEISCHSTDKSAAFTMTGDKVKKRIEHDGDSVKVRAKDIWIQPRSSGISYRIFEHYVVTPSVPFDITAMAMPTIGVMVLIQRPEGLKTRVEAIAKPTIDEGDRWECRQLFMPGEHITLKWELPAE
jgi:hypothetical protein